ncbi:hypothetical protein JDBV02_00550 [Mycobacterium phage terelak]|nr:hypothetical protein JDBV02_00550 [Mycobacterium phage terelak]
MLNVSCVPLALRLVRLVTPENELKGQVGEPAPPAEATYNPTGPANETVCVAAVLKPVAVEGLRVEGVLWKEIALTARSKFPTI